MKIEYPKKPVRPIKPNICKKPDKFISPKAMSLTSIICSDQFNLSTLKKAAIIEFSLLEFFKRSKLKQNITVDSIVNELNDTDNVRYSTMYGETTLEVVYFLSEEFLEKYFEKIYNPNYERENYLYKRCKLCIKKEISEYYEKLDQYNKDIEEWKNIKKKIDKFNEQIEME